MEFRFNKRVLKGYGIKVSAKAVQEASKIMPTTFNLDYDSATKSCFDEVVNGYMISLNKDFIKKEPYSIISIALTLNFPKLSRPALLLVGYIASKIQFDSNYIELKEKDFAGYSKRILSKTLAIAFVEPKLARNSLVVLFPSFIVRLRGTLRNPSGPPPRLIASLI